MAIQIKNEQELEALRINFGLTGADITKDETGAISLNDESPINKAVANFSNLTGRSPEFGNEADLSQIRDLINPAKASTNVANNVNSAEILTPQQQIADKTSQLTEVNKAGGSGLNVLQQALQTKIGTKQTEQTGFGLSKLYEQAGLNPSYSTLSQSLSQRGNEITSDINNLRNVLSDVGFMKQAEAEQLTGDLNLLKLNLAEIQRLEDNTTNQALSIASSLLQSGQTIPDGVLKMLNKDLQAVFKSASAVTFGARKRTEIQAIYDAMWDSGMDLEPDEMWKEAEKQWNLQNPSEFQTSGSNNENVGSGKLINLPNGDVYNDGNYAIDESHANIVRAVYTGLASMEASVIEEIRAEEAIRNEAKNNTNKTAFDIFEGYRIGKEEEPFKEYKMTAGVEERTIDKYLTEKKPNSPYKGIDVVNAANEYNISPYLLQSMMQTESQSGTLGTAALNDNNFGGITWTQSYQNSHPWVSKGSPRPIIENFNKTNTSTPDSFYVKFNTLQQGIEAIAEQIDMRTERKANDEELDNYDKTMADINNEVNTISGGTVDEPLYIPDDAFSPEAWNIFKGYDKASSLKTDRQKAIVGKEVAELKKIHRESENFSDNLKGTMGYAGIIGSTADALDALKSKVPAVIDRSDKLLDKTDADNKVNSGVLLGLIADKNPWDAKAQLLKSELNSMISGIARGIFEEVGVLTDQDIERYSKTLPNIKNTEEANALIATSFLEMALRGYKSKLETQISAKRDVSGFVGEYEALLDKVQVFYDKFGFELPEEYTTGTSGEDKIDVDSLLKEEGIIL